MEVPAHTSAIHESEWKLLFVHTIWWLCACSDIQLMLQVERQRHQQLHGFCQLAIMRADALFGF